MKFSQSAFYTKLDMAIKIAVGKRDSLERYGDEGGRWEVGGRKDIWVRFRVFE